MDNIVNFDHAFVTYFHGLSIAKTARLVFVSGLLKQGGIVAAGAVCALCSNKATVSSRVFGKNLVLQCIGR